MSGAFAAQETGEVFCPHCGAAVAEGDNCCWHCGERLPKGRSWCPECGRRFAGGQEKCPNCGTATLPGEPPQAKRSEPEPEPEPQPEPEQFEPRRGQERARVEPDMGAGYNYDERCRERDERRRYEEYRSYDRGYDSGYRRGWDEARRRGMRSEKDWLVALILSVVVGALGVHRFYVGKIGTGLLWLFTGGCFGIGWLVDLIMIAWGKFRDKKGFVLTPR